MSPVKSQHTERAGEPDTQSLSQGLLSAASAKVVTFTTLLFCAAALWNNKSFGLGEVAWCAAFIVGMIIRAPHSKRNATNAVVKSYADTRSMATFALLLTVMVLPLCYLAGWLPTAMDYSLQSWLIYTGVALQLPYLWLFYRSHADLTRNWSPGLEIRRGHELVTEGVYRHIRHPMYTAIAISAFAQPLLLQNWIAGPPGLLMTTLFLLVRVPAEERMMVNHFGDDYKSYRQRTGSLFPLLRKRPL
jgi:protein-S-isoprenylcysteine O-methyltransferase Ste14